MYKIICTNCNKETIFHSKDDLPLECSFCFEPFENDIDVIEEEIINQKNIDGLTLIYQINQASIKISKNDIQYLGREHIGAEVFSKIHFNGKPVISRKHSSISYRNGRFYIKDENSLNGTFYSVNKVNCLNNPQLIEDKSMIFFGQEPFLAILNLLPESSNIKEKNLNHINTVETPKERVISKYRCNDPNCSGFESINYVEVCPSCGAYNSLIPIYE